MEQIFIIGAGRVGTGLAIAIAATEHRVVGIHNRGDERRALAEGLIGGTVTTGDLATAPGLREATMILACVSDAAIGEIANALAGAALAEEVVVAHTSGCLDASELAAIPQVARGSIHPLCACPDPERAAVGLRQTLYAVEGDAAATARLGALATTLSNRFRVITAAQKPRYHAAAVLASNLVVALLDQAVAEGAAAGLDPGWAKDALGELAIGALARVGESDAARALTGPIARGDSTTVAKHLELLSGESREIYRLLSRRALALAEQNGLSEKAAQALASLLAPP